MSVIGPRPALWNQDVLIAEREKYHANDVRASWQEKSYFSNMAKSAEQKCWCTVSRTFLENGADRITTVQLLHSAITSQREVVIIRVRWTWRCC